MALQNLRPQGPNCPETFGLLRICLLPLFWSPPKKTSSCFHQGCRVVYGPYGHVHTNLT